MIEIKKLNERLAPLGGEAIDQGDSSILVKLDGKSYIILYGWTDFILEVLDMEPPEMIKYADHPLILLSEVIKAKLSLE